MQAELEYLEFIATISDCDVVNYHIADMRTDLHMKLIRKHGFDNYEKSKEILSNLDKAIDFNLPLMPTDHIKPYARELEYLLSRTETKYYMTGKTNKLNTPYAKLIDGVWELKTNVQ